MGASVLVIAAGSGLWLARVPIATGVIDRALAAKGVAARYGIADLGFGRQRLTNVVIGDPAHPDLVADWIETYTDVGTGGARLAGVRAGHVRLRARLIDGRVSLGALDRLLPAATGGPFALPALDVAVADARMRLATPYGVVGLSLAGRGRLDDGFRGRLAAVAPALAVAGCDLRGVTASVAIRVEKAAPRLAGPLRANTAACAGVAVRAAQAVVRVALTPALDGWTGDTRLALAAVQTKAARLAGLAGTVAFHGDAAATGGTAALSAQRFASAPASGAATTLNGDWRIAGGRPSFAGAVTATWVALAPSLRARAGGVADAARGTPLAPLATALGADLARAARRMDVRADVALAGGDAPVALLSRVAIDAASGARARLDGGAGVMIGHPAGARIDGTLTMEGGGLPRVVARLAQPAPGAAITGVATVARYARDGAVLALAPVRFAAGGAGGTRVTTRLLLSGPVADGRVDGLAMPLDLRWGGGALALDPGCTPLAFQRLAAAGLRLDAARLTLCATDGALLRIAGGRIDGGARIAAPRLTGALGTTPLSLAATGAELRLGTMGFAVDGLKARLGPADRQSRLEVARLEGRSGVHGLAGTIAGAGGQIANVPLLLDDVAGRWELAGGKLGLVGALKVRDAAATARFRPLDARHVAFGIMNGEIGAAGELYEPTKGVKVADVAIGHRLGSGSGRAVISLPGIAFGDGFQPDLLTPLTFGVIADVKGTVKGQGEIAWSADGVTSTGDFATDSTDLAAAFGPVTGIAGTIHFTDLLALESAPGQVASVKSINPGVPVTDGRITYQTLSGARVKVEQGVWPFAGGTLTLEPTLLDFSAPQERRMTFRVDRMEAAKFLQQFDFSNLNATGTFDGVLPMVFDASGGRIEGGRLVARAGGGSLAYVGGIAEKNLGFWGNFAFQALKSLSYRNLELTMNGPLAGEMITEVRFAGIRQGTGAKSNFLVRRLTRLPIVFNIRIRAPFRGLIDSAASFYDPERLVARNLQQLIEEQNRATATPTGADAKPVQPPASETVP